MESSNPSSLPQSVDKFFDLIRNQPQGLIFTRHFELRWFEAHGGIVVLHTLVRGTTIIDLGRSFYFDIGSSEPKAYSVIPDEAGRLSLSETTECFREFFQFLLKVK